ncbi:MAG: cadherin-like domain-containing protein, partial [Planctomycetales bacterium]|nr:cadherin-like domain-containing protein [Planctomycetales bacterium]
DVDAASGTMTATFTVGEGDITLVAGDSGVTITANNASTVSFTGTLSQIDALLTGTSTGTIVYNNGSDTPVASTTITLTVNDGGNTGADPSLTGDGSSEEDSASQTINITAVNDIPTTTPVTLMAIAEDSGVRTITQAELLANAYDLDLDPLTATGLSINIGLGTLVDNGDGTWGYTSAANDNTAVTFTYTVTDGTYVVAGLATLDITPVDDAPITAPESYEIYIGETISKSADKGVLSNDSDVENDPLTAVLIMGPSVGNLTLNADGSWIYVSPIDFTGTITFQYAANDGTQNSAAETVAIVILPAAPPVQQVEPAVNPTIDIENPADDDDDDDEDEDDEDQEIQEAIDLTIVEEGPASGSEARGAPNQSNELVSSLDAQFELTSIFQHAAESEENRLSRSQLDWMLNLRIGALAELANTEFFTASLRLDNNALLSSEDIRLYLATFQENTEVRDSRLELDAGIASSVFWAASAGVAVWGMSSSYFVSLAASTLPAWSRFDPIFIVNNAMNLRREDEQSLADLVSGGGSGGDGES